MGQTTSTTTTNSATTSSSSVTSLGIKIVMISDTHGHHRDVNIPDGDVLIHGGDWTQHGKLEEGGTTITEESTTNVHTIPSLFIAFGFIVFLMYRSNYLTIQNIKSEIKQVPIVVVML